MFVLIGITNGDDLIASRRVNIGVADAKEVLDAKAVEMLHERDEWLAAHRAQMETAYGTLIWPSVYREFVVEPVVVVGAQA